MMDFGLSVLPRRMHHVTACGTLNIPMAIRAYHFLWRHNAPGVLDTHPYSRLRTGKAENEIVDYISSSSAE